MADIVQLLLQGLALHRANQFVQAEALYRQVLAMDPRQFDALNLLGAIATDTGRPELGVQLAQAAIAVNGSIPLAHYYLGIAYLRLAQVGPSIAALERAIALQPEYPEALTYLGVVYQYANRHRDALEVLRRSLALRPGMAETHKSLAGAHFALGEHDAAVAACRKALEILELRARTKQSLGPNFDLREFHDIILRNGALPLNILEDQVTAWLDSKKAP